LQRALPILFTARVIALATLPLVIAALAWIAIGYFAWSPLTAAVAGFLGAPAADAAGWQRFAAQAVALLLFAALAIATALAAVAILAMPVIVRAVAQRDFPALEARRGGTFAGGVRNAIVALLLFVPLWLASLPLLVFPPLYAVAALLLNGWLAQRMFRYDALAEHASADELAVVVAQGAKRLLGLGIALAPLSFIPIVNLWILPIYAGIAFAELCLDELARLRSRAPVAAA
jgi:uncharacterized protein involved in cysteine biosynthesis